MSDGVMKTNDIMAKCPVTGEMAAARDNMATLSAAAYVGRSMKAAFDVFLTVAERKQTALSASEFSMVCFYISHQACNMHLWDLELEM